MKVQYLDCLTDADAALEVLNQKFTGSIKQFVKDNSRMSQKASMPYSVSQLCEWNSIDKDAFYQLGESNNQSLLELLNSLL